MVFLLNERLLSHRPSSTQIRAAMGRLTHNFLNVLSPDQVISPKTDGKCGQMLL